ncbi:probable serine/threonine-protein kinase fhkB [Bactrocera dorsalis]|uniref:Probable serine/threonine-protein kinase fhkB n=1 Tax=Bactrocera dorsalis TaxID=27457 RepID=A0A6I9VJA0_BACDO|nr:probable serine/threonine-protein kinase fhkB [Bactrocera dorsalis]
MKISNEFKVIVAFFCVCLIYHIDGLPQPRYGSHHHHHNSTAGNSGRHNATHHRPNNWQSHHRPNQTVDHQNHTNPNYWHPHHRPGRPWHNHHSHRRNWTQNIPISTQPINNDGGGQFAPTNSVWVAPSNSANSTNWKGGVSNINPNRGFLPQVNNGSNSDPIWHLGVAIASNLGPQPLAGSASGHKNTTNTGWNIPSGQLN